MSDNPASPLLGGNDRENNSGPAAANGQKPGATSYKRPPHLLNYSDENTPLLSREPDRENGDAGEAGGAATDLISIPSLHGDSSRKRARWRLPTIISISVLFLVLVAILFFGFAMPSVVEEYAQEAAVFEPKDLSIVSITASGVKARIKGDFVLDGSRVNKKPVRDLGRFGTFIAAAIEATPSNVHVYLPERGGAILGTAQVPSMVISIRDGEVNHLDFETEVAPGEFDGLRELAKDWVDGRLSKLRVTGKADVALKSGIFRLGTRAVSRDLLFKGSNIPTMPQYNLTKFNIHEVNLPAGHNGIAVDASATVFNDYPLTFSVPPIAFEVLVPGCMPDSSISVAEATTDKIQVNAKEDIAVTAQGLIRDLPQNLVAICPDSMKSPLDNLLSQYMNGDRTTFFVKGAEKPLSDTPTWITELMREVTVPLSITGHSFKNLIRNFTMNDVHFSLPNPIADPNTPEAQPRISAAVKVVVNLPEEMNFPVDVPHVRATADVFFHNEKLGELNLHKWQNSTSHRIEPHGSSPPGIVIHTDIENAPLNITDSTVFQKVVYAMLFGKEEVMLGVQARVDIETSSAFGNLVVRDIPAKGKVPIKPLSGHGIKSFAPKIGSLRLLDTTPSSVLLAVLVNITNPTSYSATVPFVDIQIYIDGTLVGNATTESVSVGPGINENIPVQAKWDPAGLGGEKGKAVGRDLVSRYISGYNTTLTLRTHNDSIPSLPVLGHALSNFSVDIPTPRLKTPPNPGHPDDDLDDDHPHFIDDATMHLISSTATFTLLSPLQHEIVYVTSIDATALYNHTEPVGKILYDMPIAVPPGATTTPRLPVDWSLGSVGYDAIKQALGGTLKLDARATVGVRIGRWEQELWFIGHGIGAHVKI